jgi:hypothetical protein
MILGDNRTEKASVWTRLWVIRPQKKAKKIEIWPFLAFLALGSQPMEKKLGGIVLPLGHPIPPLR